jgi:hypothetical protein
MIYDKFIGKFANLISENSKHPPVVNHERLLLPNWDWVLCDD